MATTIPTVPVGNAGNANDPADGDSVTTGIQNFGAVPYAYNIGKYEVTNSQYVEFLRAKAASDPLGLYNTRMASDDRGGITRSGVSGSFIYTPKTNMGNKPVTFASWYDSIRFANWLNNGQGTGDTETGAYTLGALGAGGVPTGGLSITRNVGATWFLPSENEWYKAAYYNPGTSSYFRFPTSTNLVPSPSGPTATPNSANFYNVVGNLTDVGAYSGTTSPYGAFDMGGNVLELNEGLYSASFRSGRGGGFGLDDSTVLQSSYRLWLTPSREDDFWAVGFRVATVPEPSTGVLAVIACGLMWCWRKRFK